MTRLIRALPEGAHVLIQGASRGIGLALTEAFLEDDGVARVFATSRRPLESAALAALKCEHPGRLELHAMDVTEEDTIARCAHQIKELTSKLHLLFNVTGLLHDDANQIFPEKSLRDLDPAKLHRSFAVNAIGPALIAKHFHPFFRHEVEGHCYFLNMSARVGSIGDNYLGGWYGYRASKAALNQLTRTLSIELGRKAPATICALIHPGTVDTDLSKPFQRNVPEDRLFDTALAAAQIIRVIDGLTPEESGEFFDWAGEPIPW
jgi:NAD(P)-dependent dehydrogenase (short-subunit alcohol dehydrogenase family)